MKSGQPLRRGKRLRHASPKRMARWDAEDEIRQAVFARDRWRCQLEDVKAAGPCRGRLTYHHRRKASQGGEFTVENGATLCLHHNCELEADADLAALAVTLGLVIRR